MHTVTSIKKLIKEAVKYCPEKHNDPRAYNRCVRQINFLRTCKLVLENGIDKRTLIDMKFNLITKVEVCLARIDNETMKYNLSNKRVPSKIIKAIKEDFNYTTSLNQIKSINFILNEKSVQ